MKKLSLLPLSMVLLILIACNQEKKGPPVVIRQITYDVVLKNPDSMPDTWNQYMDDSTRISFLNSFIRPVLAGETEAWVSGEKLSPAQPEALKKRFEWDRNKPIPAGVDTINEWVRMERITKIRYYEEWAMHRKNLLVEKRVLGIALILDDYDETGTFRGTEPLFYLFYDEAFKEKMVNRK